MLYNFYYSGGILFGMLDLVALFSLSGLPTRTNVGEIAGAVVCLEDIKQCILLFQPNPEPVILHCLKFNVYA